MISVLYRDEWLIVVDKPSGLLVHRGWDKDPVTLADIVRDQIVKQPVFALHRLDRGTSGPVMFALQSETARTMQEKMQAGEVRKTYLALVRGPMLEPCTLDHPVPGKRHGERVPSVTEFRPLAQKERWTLVEAKPRSGRLHQIRRHLKHLSHPIVGDVRYGKGDVNRFFRDHYNLCRLALHCLEVEFQHPTGKILCLQAPLPEDLRDPFTRLGIWPLESG